MLSKANLTLAGLQIWVPISQRFQLSNSNNILKILNENTPPITDYAHEFSSNKFCSMSSANRMWDQNKQGTTVQLVTEFLYFINDDW